MADEPRRVVAIRWPVDLLAEVDAAAGKGGRTRFVLDAVRAHLDGASPAAAKPEPRVNPRGVRPATNAKPPPDTPAPAGRTVRWCTTHDRAVARHRDRCIIGTKCKVR